MKSKLLMGLSTMFGREGEEYPVVKRLLASIAGAFLGGGNIIIALWVVETHAHSAGADASLFSPRAGFVAMMMLCNMAAGGWWVWYSARRREERQRMATDRAARGR